MSSLRECLRNNFYNVLFTFHYSLFSIHYSLFTVYLSLFTVHLFHRLAKRASCKDFLQLNTFYQRRGVIITSIRRLIALPDAVLLDAKGRLEP